MTLVAMIVFMFFFFFIRQCFVIDRELHDQTKSAAQYLVRKLNKIQI